MNYWMFRNGINSAEEGFFRKQIFAPTIPLPPVITALSNKKIAMSFSCKTPVYFYIVLLRKYVSDKHVVISIRGNQPNPFNFMAFPLIFVGIESNPNCKS